MKQLTEDYVSYETAVLLKEKGFVGEGEIGCRCGFYEQNKEYPSQINLVYDDLNNSELECNECLRFTQQMALKWLREVHNWYIDIRFNRHYQYYIPIVYNMSGTLESIADLEERPKQYEKAVEAALKYTLENLI